MPAPSSMHRQKLIPKISQSRCLTRGCLMASFDAKTIVKDKRFWIASFLIVWAAGLQGHMMWLQRQESFKQKFGTTEDDNK